MSESADYIVLSLLFVWPENAGPLQRQQQQKLRRSVSSSLDAEAAPSLPRFDAVDRHQIPLDRRDFSVDESRRLRRLVLINADVARMDFRLAQNMMDGAVRGQHRAVFLPTAGSCKIPAVIEAAPDARGNSQLCSDRSCVRGFQLLN